MKNVRFLVIGNDQCLVGNISDALRTFGVVEIRTSVFAEPPQDTSTFDAIIADLGEDAERETMVIRDLARRGSLCGIVIIAGETAKKQAIEKLGGLVWAYLDTPLKTPDLNAAVDGIVRFSCLRREVNENIRKLSHLEILNEITRESLLSQGDDFIWYLARHIQDRFGYFNVNVFLVNDTGDRVILRAFAGGFGQDFVEGYSLAFGEGLVGWAAQNRQSLLIGDVRGEPRRIQGFEFEEHIMSELAVPIVFENKVLGVIHTESGELNAFTRDDVMVLETIADQVALSFEKNRLARELIFMHDLSEAINDSLPVSVITADRDLNIIWANRTFLDMVGVGRPECFHQPVTRFFPEDITENSKFRDDLIRVLETGISITHANIRYFSPNHPDKVVTISLFRVQAGSSPQVMILLQDVTDLTKKAYQLSLLREISIAMQGVLERDKLLHLILTCVTAGFAIGFNRAFLFLVDADRDELRGIMGVGPTSHEEAYRIWGELSRTALTFEQYLENVNRGLVARGGLQDLVESIVIDLGETKNLLTETVKTGTASYIRDAWNEPLIDDTMRRIVISDEFVIVPLIVKNQVIGLLLADNAFSGRPITGDSIEVLTMFAAQAAIAIENAKILGDLEEKVEELEEAYRNLEKAQDMIIRNEKLAAIGEVSARLAHEIRNPLATIGGFAKSIQKKYDDRERTIRNANIIVEEVARLEIILSNVLDFTKTGTPRKTPGEVNELVRKTLGMMEGNITSRGVVVVLDLSADSASVEFDETQIRQVLINLIQNAINAMPEGGALEIRTLAQDGEIRIEVRDTGVGIPPQHLENIFEPFFTTRGNGTGLGLSISNRIVQNHGGRLEISSKEGVGTTVAIVLPRY